MSEQSRGIVELRFADASVISAFESFSLRESFIDPLGSFTFEVKPPRAKITEVAGRLQKGELVTMLVNGNLQGAFLIQRVETRVDRDGGVAFSFQCQTPLCTPYEGNVEPTIALKSQTDVGIAAAVGAALAPYGFPVVLGDATIAVNTKSGKAVLGRKASIVVDALKQQECQAQDGETAYQFCARICNHYGVALHMAANGVIMFAAPDYEQSPSYSAVQTFGTPITGADRFIDVTVTDTNEDQFSACTVRGVSQDKAGKKQTAQPKATFSAAQFSSKHPPYSSTVATHKPKIVKDKSARDAKRCNSVAQLSLGLRAARAFQVVGTVEGFVARTGRVWTVDTTARVVVEAQALDETMYLLERELRQDRSSGQTTRLTFIPIGALVLGDAS